MDIFSKRSSSSLEAADVASEQVKAYEQLLALRICTQKVLDEGNKFPCIDLDSDITDESEYAALSSGLQKGLRTVCSYLESQVEDSTSSSKKNKRRRSSLGDDSLIEWEDVVAPQESLQDSWESIVNKQYSRLHYGSEKTHSKMKVFNQTLWEQIDAVVDDEDKATEKSRSQFSQSCRLNKPDEAVARGDQTRKDDDSDSDSDDDAFSRNKRKKNSQYDHEVYDDRAFYSLLLKAFITSGNQGGGLRADDLAQLRKYRRKQQEVDRRASKGRKARYTVHKKLQNFMFPHEAPQSSLDIERLLQSLFQ
jgi:protein AATF/BFR2